MFNINIRPWNECVKCHHFIPVREIEAGQAGFRMIASADGRYAEKNEYVCADCLKTMDKDERAMYNKP